MRKTMIQGWKKWLGLALWLVVVFAAAAFGSLFQPGAWYASLAKPAFNPPNWIFGPVWTLLYLLMALAAWLVWKQGGFGSNRMPLGLFLAQLVLNGLWSWIFFGRQHIGLALLDLVLLLMVLAATVASFARAHRIAAWLLAPYLAWSSFAAVLNYALWRLN